ncbi:MAG: L,D-transpeptidase family protein [Lachnospiraceae bacterium]|nr:L,D-transpeptidase family protein [Lachnospiraceae bacterium]
MKKSRKPLLWLVLAAVVMIPLSLYLVIGFYYRENYYPGTYVNGVYCTGKTTAEINAELQTLYQDMYFAEGILKVQDAYGRQYEILLSDIQFSIDYYSQLEELKNAQNPFLWIKGLWGAANYTVFPQISFDEAMLSEVLSQCGLRENNRHTDSPEASQVEIRREGGYTLFDGRLHVLDMDMVVGTVKEALLQGNAFADVSVCYADLSYTEEMQNTILLWEKIDKFQRCGIVYDMGDTQIILAPEITSGFITLDENGEFLLDETGSLILNEEAVEAFVDELCATYNTYESTRTFLSTRGDIITIEGGTYGNVIDREAEIAYLKEAFQNKESGVHVPIYETEAYHRGINDIGDTYVEVDMTEQKLYYYEEGDLLFETDIVTGNMRRGWDTPAGVNYVYAMQRNRTLRGETYASFVKYWVPVVGNIGIHDASWRKEFGGDIYETGGSHGCINVPSDAMGELYDMLEIGVPVVMFY